MVDHVLAVRNADTGWNAFAISQEEADSAERAAILLGLDIIAVFHSHTCGSVKLSDMDRNAVVVSELAWVVVAPSLADGTVRLGVYEGGSARLVDEIAL